MLAIFVRRPFWSCRGTAGRGPPLPTAAPAKDESVVHHYKEGHLLKQLGLLFHASDEAAQDEKLHV